MNGKNVKLMIQNPLCASIKESIYDFRQFTWFLKFDLSHFVFKMSILKFASIDYISSYNLKLFQLVNYKIDRVGTFTICALKEDST